MKVMKCPLCNRYGFIVNNAPAWVRFTHLQEAFLDAVVNDQFLNVLVGGYEEFHKTCNDCITDKKNLN